MVAQIIKGCQDNIPTFFKEEVKEGRRQRAEGRKK